MMTRNIAVRFGLCCLMIFQFLLTDAQNKFTVNGTIKDKAKGEILSGAIVSVRELKGVGMSTNENGNYLLTLPSGVFHIQISMIGYKTLIQEFTLSQNIQLDFLLEEAQHEMKELVITGNNKGQTFQAAQMGVETITMKELSKIPVLMGEKDIIKAIQLMPGIKSNEGDAGLNVRGGASDQNLILLDDAPVYNASHLMGFFSTFNTDAIQEVSIYKGSNPSQYGGKLSSVLDIKMKEGKPQNFHTSIGLGLISSRIALEGPMMKDKGSFILAGRRTYADVFLKLSGEENLKKNILYFYDLNGKFNYRINEKNKVYLSLYRGRDQLGMAKAFELGWGNATATFRWNHVFHSKLFSNTSVIRSIYQYQIGMQASQFKVDITSQIRDYQLKQEFFYDMHPRNKMRFGFQVIHHKMEPGKMDVETTEKQSWKLQNKYAVEGAVFVSNDWSVNDRLSFIVGLRGTNFNLLHRGNLYAITNGKISDTLPEGSKNIGKSYFQIEPRLSMNFQINRFNALKASYTRNTQNLHLISNSANNTPTDWWIPSSNNIKPEISDQFSFGFFKNIKEKKYEMGVEVYYKILQNQLDYKDGSKSDPSDFIELELASGIGRAYGMELLFKKNTGRLTGWVGYTLSRSERKIEGINNNHWYLAKQDRTHEISVVGIFELNKNWTFSTTWVYYTGNAMTLPNGKYFIDGEFTYQYTERSNYRMPDYHRLDLGATWNRTKKAKYESSWSFSIYNVYSQENAYRIHLKQDINNPSRTKVIQTTLFKMIPSVTYQIKF